MPTMTADGVRANVGELCRIDPANSNNRYRHWMRGKIVAVHSDTQVFVQPFGHKHPEKIDIRHIRIWKARASH